MRSRSTTGAPVTTQLPPLNIRRSDLRQVNTEGIRTMGRDISAPHARSRGSWQNMEELDRMPIFREPLPLRNRTTGLGAPTHYV